MEDLCSLNFIGTGACAEIKEVSGGEIILKKLMEMGIIKGAMVKVMQNNSGPIIIKNGNSRFVIGRGMAQKILVREIN